MSALDDDDYRPRTQGSKAARDPQAGSGTADLADFLNSSRVESSGGGQQGGNYRPITIAGQHGEHGALNTAVEGSGNADGKEIACGPLLNYRRMNDGRWFGSVLVVAKGGGHNILYQPSLTMRRVGEARALRNNTAGGETNGAGSGGREITFESQRLYSDKRNTFWSFDIDVPIEEEEVKYEYAIPEMRFASESKPRTNNFFIPAANESMRIMFHSCNGFSVGTDIDAWSGAALWNDVRRKHAARPFHVMLGGGDQIYNDGIRVNGPLKEWTGEGNPKKRREWPFTSKLRDECDDYYLNNYIRWYSTEPFAAANGQIPQVNIWDDHDIIDGFGSYTDNFMHCPVFLGIGSVAHKYYRLFQHHMPPPSSTYTSDSVALQGESQAPGPNQLIDAFVAPAKTDLQYILGSKPGPYVSQPSFNIYARLGARIALMGIDARTERTRHQVNYPETYKLVFDRVRSELSAAESSGQPIKHLIVLLGIPIAYPRLSWLENILRSPIIGPIKFMNRRFGLGGDFFNHFDGGVDLLDDLDDHYTARTHKVERANLVHRLQQMSDEHSVRVTILGGDVHLAALGRFYSNPKLQIPVEEDSRYMANVVSSAIVNKPPPQAIANLLARRNKIHHLDRHTDETLLNFFDKDPGTSVRTASFNHSTMPSRNFAMLTENSLARASYVTNGAEQNGVNGAAKLFLGKDGHSVLHQGEVDSGTNHKAAGPGGHGQGHDGSLDICINVEMDQHDPEGRTEGYGMTVPMLTNEKGSGRSIPGSQPVPMEDN